MQDSDAPTEAVARETLGHAFDRWVDSVFHWAAYLTKFFVIGALTLGFILTVFLWLGPWDEPAAVLGFTVFLTPAVVFTTVIVLWAGALVVGVVGFVGWAIIRFGRSPRSFPGVEGRS